MFYLFKVSNMFNVSPFKMLIKRLFSIITTVHFVKKLVLKIPLYWLFQHYNIQFQNNCRHLSGLIIKRYFFKIRCSTPSSHMNLYSCHKHKNFQANKYCNDKMNWLCICKKKRSKIFIKPYISCYLFYKVANLQTQNWDFNVSNIYQNMYSSL